MICFQWKMYVSVYVLTFFVTLPLMFPVGFYSEAKFVSTFQEMRGEYLTRFIIVV
jgi:hypothetical protein